MELAPGLTATVELTVSDADTAVALGSGDVPVLGTPRVLALAEEAACSALHGALPEGHTSVGARVELDHLAPTPVGATVTARATLDAVDGRRLEFSLQVVEGDRVVARGRHRRAVVERAAFAG